MGLSVEPTSDIRVYLQKELLKRCRSNRGYSLRAFAKFLKVESSALSKMLNGKRAISPKMFNHICDRLALHPEERRSLRASVTERRGQKPRTRPSETRDPHYAELAFDQFAVISDWYHFAILELTQTKDFSGDARAIARTLGISHAEAKAAVDRLLRIGLLQIDNGVYRDLGGSLTNISDLTTSIAHRHLQLQLLEKSRIALEELGIESRDHTGMTMAIDTRLLPEAKIKIAQFRRELTAYLQSSPDKNAVYQFSLSLFPLSRSNESV